MKRLTVLCKQYVHTLVSASAIGPKWEEKYLILAKIQYHTCCSYAHSPFPVKLRVIIDISDVLKSLLAIQKYNHCWLLCNLSDWAFFLTFSPQIFKWPCWIEYHQKPIKILAQTFRITPIVENIVWQCVTLQVDPNNGLWQELAHLSTGGDCCWLLVHSGTAESRYNGWTHRRSPENCSKNTPSVHQLFWLVII